MEYENVCPSGASALESLYADHQIEDEMVIGPVEIWKPIKLKFVVHRTEKTKPVKRKEENTQIKPYHCKICNTENIKHYTCEQCNKRIFNRRDMIRHTKMHKRPERICQICNKEFKSRSKLTKHMLTHTSTCNMCDKLKSSQSSHNCAHEKAFKCEYCPKTKLKGLLQSHLKRHTGERPFSCDTCLKTFTRQTSLNNHVLIHKGIKPYSCKLCSMRFRQISNLSRHLETKHSMKMYIHELQLWR